MKIRIPAAALTGTGNTTRAFLTKREALALATDAGFQSDEASRWLSTEGSIPLPTGAKLSAVPTWLRRRACPTRARVFQVYGYHYDGADVTSLVEVAA